MARKGRRKRPSKKVPLFIVEGDTEENYIKLLKFLYRKGAKPKNCGGGNAKSVLREAKKQIAKHQGYYSGYIVWFDLDAYEPNDANLLHSVKSRPNVTICVSEPCVENWLLAHFQEPLHVGKSCKTCINQLEKHIPHYDKSDFHLLKRHVNIENIPTAVTNYNNLSPIVEYFTK